MRFPLASTLLFLSASASPLPWQPPTCTTTGPQANIVTVITIANICTSFVSLSLGGDGISRWISVGDTSWTSFFGVPARSAATYAKIVLLAEVGSFLFE
ncbi:hypothetical protein BDD12DRAFT_864779 [Trichophaea hybrida]|nr:hypothetical protein BDD12DRAFT_864779 [Trichophaea hybrida]